MGRRAFPLDVKVSEHSVKAGHDGYSELGVTHHRDFVFRMGTLEIVDELGHSDSDLFRGTAHFHFHPDVKIEVRDDSVEFDGMIMSFFNYRTVVVSDYEYCLGFSKTATAKVVNVEFSGRLVSEIIYANTVHNRQFSA